MIETPMASLRHFVFLEKASFARRRVQFNNFFLWLRKLPKLEIFGLSESTLEVKQATNIIVCLGMRNVGHAYKDRKAFVSSSDC